MLIWIPPAAIIHRCVERPEYRRPCDDDDDDDDGLASRDHHQFWRECLPLIVMIAGGRRGPRLAWLPPRTPPTTTGPADGQQVVGVICLKVVVVVSTATADNQQSQIEL